ncbi:MAG: peptide chain release factor N(5)-glutamine methyltransferase [Microgenomates group bacterium]
MTGNEALRAAVAVLKSAGLDDPSRDSRLLLAHSLDILPDRLTLHLQDMLTKEQQQQFDGAIAARLTRQPVSQIIGKRLFWGQWFKVTQDTLDPRPETETLVQAALERPFVKILDLGTGTGCILISCLRGMPMAMGVGVDVSEPALAVARTNAQVLGVATRAKFVASDWFSTIQDRFDLIVANPPYITSDEMALLSPDVLNWEPHLALTPGGDGLDSYRIITAGAGARLLAGGRIALEIGPTQGVSVATLLRQAGFVDVTIVKDMDNRDRVVIGHKAIATD